MDPHPLLLLSSMYQLSNAEDTSNFDTYPDSEEEVCKEEICYVHMRMHAHNHRKTHAQTSMPEYSGTDPFIQWDLDQGADVDE